jgi:hypothetical protein
MSRPYRERLIAAGFLRPIVKGWYMPSRPAEGPADSAAWVASMFEFVRAYCDSRFGASWYVSPELSVRLHAGTTEAPAQVVVHAEDGTNTTLALPQRTSLFEYAAKDFAPKKARVEVGRLRALALPWALARVSEQFFRTYPRDAQLALAQLPDASALLEVLLEGGHSVVAGRLAGALRATGRADLADAVREGVRSAGYTCVETNPFARPLPTLAHARRESPHAARLRLLWKDMRDSVLAAFPPEPGMPADAARYFTELEERYVADAYHSLSIEGYRVSTEVIERVRSGDWNPDAHKGDADARDAMAAHGYWLAHNAVRRSIERIFAGDNAGRVSRQDHGAWYRALFAPSVTAGLLKATQLAGYRNDQVYIRDSRHIPPSKEAVRDCMPALFELLESEDSAAVRAVLGHFAFVFIHPYMDGNGRMARFLMNAMLASGGYPWTIVRLEIRTDYLGTLEQASVHGNIEPFVRLLGFAVRAQADPLYRASAIGRSTDGGAAAEHDSPLYGR